MTGAIQCAVTRSEVTFWESVAKTRWGAYATGVEERVIRQAAALAAPPGQALEIGCDGGRWSKMLADFGWKMTCIDVNRETLAICQRRVPGARCILASPKDDKVACESASLSLLLCVEVVPVIQSHWFLGEACRALKDGGVLVGVWWNAASWRGLMFRLKSLVRGRSESYYTRAYAPWRTQLLKAGLRLVHEEGFCWGPFGRASDSPLVPLFVRSEQMLGLRRLPAISPWIAFIAKKSGAV
ncbi:MAG TPA: methyltransferase domain-containing protein [Dongiaceae bacterium]|nr:methyltransferase domain-containing protein [Dongiaceae bacterium]